MQAIDLFSGAGGMSIGAVNSGIKVRYAVECNPSSIDTYKCNHKGVNVIGKDIRKVCEKDFNLLNRNIPTIIFGGAPCQGFSSLNLRTRNVKNINNWLFEEYLRIAKMINPEWLLFENVKGIKKTENGLFLSLIREGFEKMGYTTSEFVLNSNDYGVPQSRERVFLIGSINGLEVKKIPPLFNQERVTVREAFEDLPDLPNGNKVDKQLYKSLPMSRYAKLMRSKKKICSNNIVTQNKDFVIKRYGHIPQGGNWRNIPKRMMKNYKNTERCHAHIYHRLDPNNPSIVISNFRKGMIIHPYQDRGLSVREASRLQSFPDSFVFKGTLGEQQQQVGNAVPPILARAVFNAIMSS